MWPGVERGAFHQKIEPDFELPSGRDIASFRGPILVIGLAEPEPVHHEHELTLRFFVRPYRGSSGSPVMYVFHIVLTNARVPAGGDLQEFVKDAAVTSVGYDGFQI